MAYRIIYTEKFNSEKKKQYPSAGAPFVVVTNPNLSPRPKAHDPGAYTSLQDKTLQTSTENTSKEKAGSRQQTTREFHTTLYSSSELQDNDATGSQYFTSIKLTHAKQVPNNTKQSYRDMLAH